MVFNLYQEDEEIKSACFVCLFKCEVLSNKVEYFNYF